MYYILSLFRLECFHYQYLYITHFPDFVFGLILHDLIWLEYNSPYRSFNHLYCIVHHHFRFDKSITEEINRSD